MQTNITVSAPPMDSPSLDSAQNPIDLTGLGFLISVTVWGDGGHTWFVPSPAFDGVDLTPPTDHQKLMMLKVTGMEASHDLGCAASGVAGQIPFVGHALGGALTGQIAGAIDETGMIASQSGTLARGIGGYAGTIRQMGASAADVRGLSIAAGQVAKYGPFLEKFAGGLKGATFVVGAAATIYDFNQCVSGR